MSEKSFIELLADNFNLSRTPANLTSVLIGKVVQLSPIIVQLLDNKVLLEEDVELEIAECFRFRCNIDKDLILSDAVSQNIEAARNVTETHSYSGSPCNMPQAITYLADAILGVRDELLALKCELEYGDYVVISSLEEADKYILVDKVDNKS